MTSENGWPEQVGTKRIFTPASPAAMPPHLRVARPVSNLQETVAQYQRGLGWKVIGQFAGHSGFDGAMLGNEGECFHVEFTVCQNHPVKPSPTPEDLLVFYIPDFGDWAQRCELLFEAGFREVPSFNPYWMQQGRTFEDRDGYRLVIERAAWNPRPAG
jgi:catechol 2,3-dioxygenase-like lactoylglutathione lyase family enzyme